MNVYQVMAVSRKKGEIESLLVDVQTILADDIESARTEFTLKHSAALRKQKGAQIIVRPFYEE